MFVWLSIALVFLLFEIAHPGLFLFLSFCFGALAGALLSWLECDVMQQSIAALLVTFLACVLLFYWVRARYGQFRKGIDTQSNVYALLGQRAFVTKAIEYGQFGFVKINGEIWMARSLYEGSLALGQEVEVISVRGAHVIVEKINNTL